MRGTTRRSRGTIRLPDTPPPIARYDAANLKVVAEDGKASPIDLTGGHVAIDQKKHEITVELQTRDGPFLANGTYTVRF